MIASGKTSLSPHDETVVRRRAVEVCELLHVDTRQRVELVWDRPDAGLSQQVGNAEAVSLWGREGAWLNGSRLIVSETEYPDLVLVVPNVRKSEFMTSDGLL